MTDAERLDLLTEAVFIIVHEQLSGNTQGNRFQRLAVIAGTLGGDMNNRGHAGQVAWIISNLTPTDERLHYRYGGEIWPGNGEGAL